MNTVFSMDYHDTELYQKAKEKIHRPLPHVESMFGWRLSTDSCFAQAGGYARNDFGGHQCNRKPKYHIGFFQFCAQHAKELSPTFEGLDKITEPLFTVKSIKINTKKF